jgi:beta-lactamase regulating signal transducer with metallopeptidase domain
MDNIQQVCHFIWYSVSQTVARVLLVARQPRFSGIRTQKEKRSKDKKYKNPSINAVT